MGLLKVDVRQCITMRDPELSDAALTLPLPKIWEVNVFITEQTSQGT